MTKRTAANKHWTKELVLAEAQKYQTVKEWREAKGGSRQAASANGWYEEATAHMTKTVGSVSWKWTKEAVIADAAKYKSKSEWRKASKAYAMASRNGWLNEACSHMGILWKAKWDKANVLADAIKYKSRSLWERSSSGAYASAVRNGWYEEATAHMERLIESWTKDKILTDAKQYKTRGEYFANSSGYSIAINNGWLEEACSHMIKTYSYGELVIYIYLLQHDIKFTHQKKFDDLRHINKLPFDFYLPNFNLVIEYNGIQHKRGWEGNPANAEEIKFRDQLKIDYANANSINYLMIDEEKELSIISKIDGLLKSLAKKLRIDFIPVKRELSPKELNIIANLGRLTKEYVLQSASRYKTISEWKRGDESAYSKSLTAGWKDEATVHMTRKNNISGFWTKEKVLESAKSFNTQVDWKNTYGGAWSKAIKMGWIKEATLHMTYKKLVKPNGYWTKEKVMESANKFKTKSAWRRSEPSAIAIATKNGWLAEATAHM
jgi:hypothetical protein